MIDKDLFKLLGDNRKLVFFVVFSMSFSLLANIAISASICWIIYYVISDDISSTFVYPVLALVLSVIIRYITSLITDDIKDRIGRKVKKDLREKTYEKIIRLGTSCVDSMSLSGLTQISIEGIEQLDLYYSTYLPQFFYSLIAPIILFIITVFIDYKTALVLLACVPLIPLSIIGVSKYAKKIFAKYWNIYISMGDKFLDSIQGLSELKVLKADARQNKIIDEHAENFHKVTMKVLVMQLFSTSIMDLVAYGGAGVGIALTILDLEAGVLMVPQALFLILIAVEFFLPLRALGSAFHVAMNGVSAGKKIINLLNREDPLWGDINIEDTSLILKDVSFSYDGKREVLKDVSISLPKNNLVVIVGKSGCGKSTIVSLLLGSYYPQKGEVLVGDENIINVRRDDYYSHIALVSYNTYIFNQSVRENFQMAKANISDKEIEDTCNIIYANDFILEAKDVSFNIKDKIILKNINHSFKRGSRTVILGENGCGKTTLLRLLAKLYIPSEGKIIQYIDSRLKQRKRGDKKYYQKVGIIYQNPDYQLFMPSVEKELYFSAYSLEYANEIASLFELKNLYARHPQSLSEGQKRRLSIACVLASKPEVVLLDEPTVGQDYEFLAKLVNNLNYLHAKTNNTLITITHDIRCASALADESLIIKEKQIIKSGGKELIKEYFAS